MENPAQIIKNYWNNRPCNVRHSDKSIESKDYFDEVAARRYFVEPHIEKFCNFVKYKDKKILELGCGIGTDAINFAKNGAIVTCVDISEKSIEIAKKGFLLNNLQAEFYNIDLEKCHEYLPANKYDLIYSFGVIHHAENPQNIINAIKNYCHEQTEIKIMLYNKYSWKTFEFFIKYGYKFQFNLNKTIKYFAEAQLGCPYAYVYTKAEISNLFKDFQIVDHKIDHIFIYNIEEYINKNYVVRPIFKFMPAVFLRFLKRNFGWHHLITLKLK